MRRQSVRLWLIVAATAVIAFFVASIGTIVVVNGVVYALIHGATHTTPPPHGRLIAPGTADLIGLVFATVAALRMGQALSPSLRPEDATSPRTSQKDEQLPPPQSPPRQPPPPATGPTKLSQLSVADELAQFADLKAAGLLTQREFDKQKTKLLSQ
jgi:hypothetical protein